MLSRVEAEMCRVFTRISSSQTVGKRAHDFEINIERCWPMVGFRHIGIRAVRLYLKIVYGYAVRERLADPFEHPLFSVVLSQTYDSKSTGS